MLQNAYFLAKIGADAAKNEQQFAEIFAALARLRAGAAFERGALVRAPRPARPARADAGRDITV